MLCCIIVVFRHSDAFKFHWCIIVVSESTVIVYSLCWTEVCVNFVAYLFMRTKKKDTDVEDEVVAPGSTTAAVTAPVEKPLPSPTIKEPPKLREPISENQQRELFKWILEEKRKVKTKDPEEKKRVDEEKAILKEFIRAKSIPSI